MNCVLADSLAGFGASDHEGWSWRGLAPGRTTLSTVGQPLGASCRRQESAVTPRILRHRLHRAAAEAALQKELQHAKHERRYEARHQQAQRLLDGAEMQAGAALPRVEQAVGD